MKYFIICGLLVCIGTTLIASQHCVDLSEFAFRFGILITMFGMLGMFGIEINNVNKSLFKIESDIIRINENVASLNIRSKNLDKRIKQIDIKLKG